jgi:hypothetical protein
LTTSNGQVIAAPIVPANPPAMKFLENDGSLLPAIFKEIVF